MTESEAIKELQNLYKTPFLLDDEELEAFEVAIKAIKKQISKKPKITQSWYRCPTCGATHEICFGNYGYCPNCGQKIDWSGEND